MRGGAERNGFLSRVKEGVYCVAKRPPVKTTSPAVPGTIAEYIAKRAGTPQAALAQSVLLNKVRVCPACGKPNGFTLATCNGCQRDLSAVGTSFTNNLFSAFMLGIEREPRFPLTLSLRAETDRLMVFDDPLALSPMHFCAVPTTAFIPDWRYLTLRPRDGLAVSQELVQACNRAAEAQFLSDPMWCSSLLAPGAFDVKDMIMGYNYPPSQGQLHLQYMLPLLMPHQYMMFLRGVHYTVKRFFPLAFVESCLRELVERGDHLDAADLERPVEAFLDVLRAKCGVHYYEEHEAFLERVGRQQQQLANWKRESFGGVARLGDGAKADELSFEPFDEAGEGRRTPATESAVYEREKRILQNYGRSRGDGTPSMGYYTYAKQLEDLDMSFACLS